MSNIIRRNIFCQSLTEKKYEIITESAKIFNFPKDVCIVEYAGDDIRMVDCPSTVKVLCPRQMSDIQTNALSNALDSGTLFEDASLVRRTADMIRGITLPIHALSNKLSDDTTKGISISAQIVIGKLDENTGRVEIDDVSHENCNNYMKDLCEKHGKISSDKILDNYMSKDGATESIDDKELNRDIDSIQKEIESINDLDEDDEITEDDYEFLSLNDADGNETEEAEYDDKDDAIQEGFITKRPKKLKPIPRDIIPYITVELNAIQDANDQAMLSGYTCSKMELVDFYLNVIDTNDGRYIVPHTKQYLENMQRELDGLLTRILNVRPINRNDRAWRVNVNYPENWRG